MHDTGFDCSDCGYGHHIHHVAPSRSGAPRTCATPAFFVALRSPHGCTVVVSCPGQGHYRWSTLLRLTARRAGLTPQRPPSVRHGAFLTARATYPKVTATLRCLIELLPCRGVNALPARSLFRYYRPLSAKDK